MPSLSDTTTCASCKHAELQCPPILLCTKHKKTVYFDTNICDVFEAYEDSTDEDL